MQPKFLKKRDLVSTSARQGRYPFSSSTLWRKVRAGAFPAPVVLAGVQCWPLDVLERWEAQQLAASSALANGDDE